MYLRYLEAASKAGFVSFVVATILQQITSLMGNNMLREWGNHNSEVGGNEGAGVYLLGYGMASLSSTILGAVAALLIWVLCSVRSARKLHDSVSDGWMSSYVRCDVLMLCRCSMLSCMRRSRSSSRLPLAGQSQLL